MWLEFRRVLFRSVIKEISLVHYKDVQCHYVEHSELPTDWQQIKPSDIELLRQGKEVKLFNTILIGQNYGDHYMECTDDQSDFYRYQPLTIEKWEIYHALKEGYMSYNVFSTLIQEYDEFNIQGIPDILSDILTEEQLAMLVNKTNEYIEAGKDLPTMVDPEDILY